MTKPLTKEQKAANKAARAFKRDALPLAKAAAKIIKPIASAGDGIQQQSDGALVSTDRPEVVAALPAPDTSPNMAQVDARARRKLDTDTERKQPMKGVRGKIAPKPAKEPAKRAGRKAATDAPREKKYIDHGTQAAHRFEGTMWNGTKVRTAKGGYGLELKGAGGGWVRQRSDEEFYCPNPDRWRRALQQAQRDKSVLPPNAAKGQPRAEKAEAKPRGARKIKASNGAEAPAPVKERKPRAARSAVAPVVDTERWKKAPVAPVCQWSVVIQGQKCDKVSQRRVVCNSGASFADVCSRHEQQFLSTKSSKWVGCSSYALTPSGVKLDAPVAKNETPADQAVSV